MGAEITEEADLGGKLAEGEAIAEMMIGNSDTRSLPGSH